MTLATIEQDTAGRDLLAHRDDFVRMLGTTEDADRLIQEAYSALNQNPDLRKCAPATLFGALYFAAQLGLPVGGPLQQFHLTPRLVWNPALREKEWQIVPIVGYNGYITLAMNTGEYDAIEGKLVHAHDDFEEPYDDESGTHFKLRPAKGDRGEIIGVIGRALVKGADRSVIEYVTVDEIRKRMMPSNWEKTPWKTDFAAMVKKTGIRRVSKYTSKSRASHRFALALAGDQAVVTVAETGELEMRHEDAPTEDWKTLIAQTDDKAALESLWKRMGQQESEQVLAEFRPLIIAHAATLTKDSRKAEDRPSAAERAAAQVGREHSSAGEGSPPQAPPAEPSQEAYEAAEAARFDAAVAAGEVHGA